MSRAPSKKRDSYFIDKFKLEMNTVFMRINAKLIWAIVTCELVGLAGTPFTIAGIHTWYSGLHKPMLNPPSWVFGPVWTVLYLLMGISLFLVWNKKTSGSIKITQLLGIQMFILQLCLNFFWSLIFFTWHQSFFALWELAVLWMTIMVCIIVFFKISKASAYILIPYLLWVTFAGYLNYNVWILNR